MKRIVATWGLLAATVGCGSSHGNHAASNSGGDDAGASNKSLTPPSPTAGCGAASTVQSGSFDFTYQNVQYSYIVYVPQSYDGKAAVPLVLNWHGLGGDGAGQESYTQMDPLADREGFIVVYPSSPDNSWNAGTCCAFTASTRDDVGFAMALVADIEGKACIDSKRVYTTGFSNGGFMTFRLGCEHAETFAAIAPASGKVGVANCKPSRPVPVLAFHGTADPVVPYSSALLSAENLDVPGTLKAWADRDGCMNGPDMSQFGNVTCQTWSGCDAGAIVTLCSASGGTHCWPGGYDPTGSVGPCTKDINATGKIGAFFQMFSLP